MTFKLSIPLGIFNDFSRVGCGYFLELNIIEDKELCSYVKEIQSQSPVPSSLSWPHNFGHGVCTVGRAGLTKIKDRLG